MQAEEPAAAADEDRGLDNGSVAEPALEDEEEGAEELLQVHAAADSEAFDAAMKDRLRDQGDRFEEMVAHEEDIRLGDDGWKERYYQVRVWCLLTTVMGFPPCLWHGAVMCLGAMPSALGQARAERSATTRCVLCLACEAHQSLLLWCSLVQMCRCVNLHGRDIRLRAERECKYRISAVFT